MADRRALAIGDGNGLSYLEIPDTDVLKIASISPGTGDLTLGGATAADGVVITAGHDLDMSGDSVFTLAGTGNLNITASGTHAISAGTLDVNVTSDFSNTVQLSAGADLTAGAGSVLSGFDSIEGILSGNLVDKSASETITGQWTYQSAVGVNPKMIVKAAGGEPADTILFQVQTSAGANLFSVDTEGDVVIAGGETVAGAVVYTGDISLGDGGNTIKIGADTTPAVGDNVYLNTTGTADGQFSLTTANIAIDTSGNITGAGDIDLDDTLSFAAVGYIDTSGNNNLNISTGTANLVVTAGLVDLQTNVTSLDVPDGTGLSIGGTALTTTNWTATAVDIVLGDGTGNADAYHTHSGLSANNELAITGQTTAAMSQYQAGYISANNTWTPTNCSFGGGATPKTATFGGVFSGTAGEMIIAGKVEVQFDAALSPAAGDAALLSFTNTGQFTNVPPSTGSKNYQTKAGIILDTSNYATVQRCVILLQPDAPVQR